MLFYIMTLLLCFLLCPKHTFMYRYGLGVLFAVDCLLNVALLLGDYRETISSRVGKAHNRGVTWILPVKVSIDGLFYILTRETNHCYNAIQILEGDKAIIKWR